MTSWAKPNTTNSNPIMTIQRLAQWGTRLMMASALSALLTACSSTRIQSTRTAAGLAAAPIHNIMVAGMDNRSYVREAFENDMVGFLRKHGVDGTASFTRLSFDELKGGKEQIRQKLLAAKVESILFVRVTDRTDFVQEAPTSLDARDEGAVSESLYNSLTAGGGDISTALRLGARLYRVPDGAVIWSGVLNTVMKEDTDSFALMRSIAKSFVDQMAKDKVIP
jgi:hypothetical protein